MKTIKRILITLLLLALSAISKGTFRTYAQSGTTIVQQTTTVTVYSQNAEANDLFLKAREYFNKSDPRTGGKLANAREAIKLYEQAVSKDPKFALAYVGLSRAWLQLGYSDPDGLSNKEIIPPAKAALLKALAIADKSADVHIALAGLYYSLDFDWVKAEAEYKLAGQLAPQIASAHSGYAGFLTSMARFDEAISEEKQAEGIAPSFATDLGFARIYYSMRRYDQAAEYCKRSLQKQDNVLGHFFLGFVYIGQHKNDEAIAEFEKATTFSNNGGAWAGLSYGYAMVGRKDDALKILNELEHTEKRGHPVPYRVAAVYLALGDKDKAIDWLRKEYEESGNWMNQLKVDPVMDPLRSDPRFQDLMHKMKFVE
jgi:tetratricopeptide (TPR) repeat protein